METKTKKLVGKYLNKSGDKTIRVLVETRKMHPMYKKVMKVSKKYLVHNETNQEFEVGQVVTIISDRKSSRRKAWRLAPESKR